LHLEDEQNGLTKFSPIYIIKDFVQPKMSLNREFCIWIEQGRGVREREGLMGGSKGSHI
jgi:hypothetical protein